MNNNLRNWAQQDDVIEQYAQDIMDGMDMKTMECFVYDTLCDNLSSYSDEELIAEVTEYNPELIEGWLLKCSSFVTKLLILKSGELNHSIHLKKQKEWWVSISLVVHLHT